MTENITNTPNEELVKQAGETVVGTPSGLKAQYAQAELTRRLMNSINNLNKISSKYSQRLIWLTIVLGILAAIQIYLLVK